MKLVRQEVDGAILSTSQQAHVNLWLVMFLGMHLESASKQWGVTAKGTTANTITYPVSVNDVLGLIACSTNTESAYTVKCTSITTSGFKENQYQTRYGCYWVLIAK